jgi:hypothetical protein
VKARRRAATAVVAGAVAGTALTAAVILLVRGNPATIASAAGAAGAFAAGVATTAGTYRVKNRAGAPSAKPTAGMRAAARLMPRGAGQEWLAEAHSILFEVPPQARRAVIRSYLFAAPRVLAAAWGCVLTGRLRAARGASAPGDWGKGS